jgi:membrane fusion protein, heavy metal efflux system
MQIPSRYQHQTLLVILLSLSLNSPSIVSAEEKGHDHSGASSFKDGGKSSDKVTVDAETIKRLGIQVEAVKIQPLDIGIKTTGQIETLPNQKVDVTAPLTSKVIQLLVKPGSRVIKGQPLATIASPELVDLRVNSQGKQADAQGALQKARVNLQLAQDNLSHQQTIANAEVAQARTKFSAAKARYDRDLSIVNQRGVLKVAQENLKRQQQIAKAEITRSNTEVTIAQEQYDRDRELVTKGALARRQMLESQAKLERAKADSAKAKNLPQVVQAESEVKKAEVDLPYRELRESQARVAEAESQLKRAETRRDVLEAQAQLKRAKSDVVIAQSQLNLSGTAYQTRLKQLGSTANAQGFVTITAPIAGTIASREVSVGQSLQDAGGKLMTIVNDSQLFATANIYEKDLGAVKIGQKIKVKIAALPNQVFEGNVTQIGTSVQGESRVVPVQAEINNLNGALKPGMFAELEVITDRTASPLLSIPTAAIVEANGKKIIYVENGKSFQSVEPVFGRTSGNTIEVTSGLFDGDKVVTKRATQLYAQSLRGGSEKAEPPAEAAVPGASNNLPPWLLPVGVATLVAGGIATGSFLLKRKRANLGAVDVEDSYAELEPEDDLNYPNLPVINGSTHELNHQRSSGSDVSDLQKSDKKS